MASNSNPFIEKALSGAKKELGKANNLTTSVEGNPQGMYHHEFSKVPYSMAKTKSADSTSKEQSDTGAGLKWRAEQVKALNPTQ